MEGLAKKNTSHFSRSQMTAPIRLTDENEEQESTVMEGPTSLRRKSSPPRKAYLLAFAKWEPDMNNILVRYGKFTYERLK